MEPCSTQIENRDATNLHELESSYIGTEKKNSDFNWMQGLRHCARIHFHVCTSGIRTTIDCMRLIFVCVCVCVRALKRGILQNWIRLLVTLSIFLWLSYSVVPSRSVGRDSSVGIETRYGLDRTGIESIGGTRFSAPVQSGPGVHPFSCTVGTGSILGSKVAGAWRWPPTPSSAKVKERVELYPSTCLGLHGVF
jgi:hypothetical protein